MRNFFLPPLYAIVNISGSADPDSSISSLVRAGIELLQIRCKGLSRKDYVELLKHAVSTAATATEASSNSPPLILANDDPEACMQAECAGVHLGQNDPSPSIARTMLGPDKVIGLSTHNLSQLRRAPFELLDYAALGPIFESPTKQGHAPTVGLEVLSTATKFSPIPIVAIGGITLENAVGVFAAGAESAAVISDLQNAKDLREAVKRYYAARQRPINPA